MVKNRDREASRQRRIFDEARNENTINTRLFQLCIYPRTCPSLYKGKQADERQDEELINRYINDIDLSLLE